MLHRDNASFRDPDGFIFYLDNIVYRSLTREAKQSFLNNARFYSEAVKKGLLLPFEFAESVSDGAGGLIEWAIRPTVLPIVTYPHEWSFEQLKDAALNTLDLNLLAIEHGLTLKDASAFNVQYFEGRTVFIDHTSFEPSDGMLPWRPYSQFCRHFLNPLVISSHRDLHSGTFFRLDIDGIPQQLANDLLPAKALLSPSILMHMIMHGRFIRKSSQFEGRATSARSAPRSAGKQSDLLRQLRSFIATLSPAKAGTTWSNYYNDNNYDQTSFSSKKSLVSKIFADRTRKSVWDLGANDGTFSRLITGHSDMVLSLDLDHNAVNENYSTNRHNQIGNIHSLVYDVGNPTPGLGFSNAERSRLEDRSKPEAILALAVIHHLSLTNNIPFELTAQFFADRAKELVIEFVDRDDSQVKRLLAQKNVSYDWYNEDHFRQAFARHFNIVSSDQVESAHRRLYHLTRKS